MILGLVQISGAVGIALLLAYRFAGRKQYGFWGQVALIICFSFASFALVRAKAFWTGAAAALPAIAQVYALAATRIRKLKASR